MAGWEQQLFCEQRRWHEEFERRVQKMERDVERGRKLTTIWNAEAETATSQQTETELEHEHDRH
jgi:hypothetical protein